MSNRSESAFFRKQESSEDPRCQSSNAIDIGAGLTGRVINPFTASITAIPGIHHAGRWLHLIQPDPGGGFRPLMEHTMLGGRWSPPRSFPVLYTAEDDPATREELIRWLQANERSDSILIRIHVHLGRLLDLCDPANREALGSTSEELADAADMGVCQAIGVAAYRTGFQGILYPRPARCELRNLAIFPERVAETDLSSGDSL
jgi:hypothetical protein